MSAQVPECVPCLFFKAVLFMCCAKMAHPNENQQVHFTILFASPYFSRLPSLPLSRKSFVLLCFLKYQNRHAVYNAKFEIWYGIRRRRLVEYFTPSRCIDIDLSEPVITIITQVNATQQSVTKLAVRLPVQSDFLLTIVFQPTQLLLGLEDLSVICVVSSLFFSSFQ